MYISTKGKCEMLDYVSQLHVKEGQCVYNK